MEIQERYRDGAAPLIEAMRSVAEHFEVEQPEVRWTEMSAGFGDRTIPSLFARMLFPVEGVPSSVVAELAGCRFREYRYTWDPKITVTMNGGTVLRRASRIFKVRKDGTVNVDLMVKTIEKFIGESSTAHAQHQLNQKKRQKADSLRASNLDEVQTFLGLEAPGRWKSSIKFSVGGEDEDAVCEFSRPDGLLDLSVHALTGGEFVDVVRAIRYVLSKRSPSNT